MRPELEGAYDEKCVERQPQAMHRQDGPVGTMARNQSQSAVDGLSQLSAGPLGGPADLLVCRRLRRRDVVGVGDVAITLQRALDVARTGRPGIVVA